MAFEQLPKGWFVKLGCRNAVVTRDFSCRWNVCFQWYTPGVSVGIISGAGLRNENIRGRAVTSGLRARSQNKSVLYKKRRIHNCLTRFTVDMFLILQEIAIAGWLTRQKYRSSQDIRCLGPCRI